MSILIMCDACKKRMNANGRENGYHEIVLECNPPLHLCDECFDKMIKNTFHATKEELHINGRLYFS